MAQHDYVIANGTGAAVRSDLNNALAAIVSQNSGATEPTTTYAYQFWADTTTNLLKIRNAANSAWITLRELDGTLTIEDGTAAAPGLAFADDLNTGIYSPSDNALGVTTDGVERVKFGTTEAVFNDGGANYDFRVEGDTNSNLIFADASADYVGIGKSNPSALLDLGTATPIVRFSDTDLTGYHEIRSSNTNFIINADPTGDDANSSISFNVDGSERARVDSSGRLLVGTSSARANFYNAAGSAAIQIEGTTQNTSSSSLTQCSADAAAPVLVLNKSRNASVGGNTIVNLGDQLGNIIFQGNDGSEFVEAARIKAEVDGTPGANDMPGRLVFSTSADGASSSTERMRITSAGGVLIGTTSTATASEGVKLNGEFTGSVNATVDGGRVLVINRLTNDGNLVEFYQATTLEGAISVSGTTVTYGGGHLARWSQLPNNEDPSEILKGTVMSNLDEMCEWGDEDNEQLNKTKISDVEGDPNVAGVFVSTDFTDDGPLDFFVGMTGDMVIRIAEGVTVERGDLLMSAGDGTAKPQDDDIIRSKTIAKVTSTNVSCTYDDGSYCVPCVLMAC